jgi:hypothetical protein
MPIFSGIAKRFRNTILLTLLDLDPRAHRTEIKLCLGRIRRNYGEMVLHVSGRFRPRAGSGWFEVGCKFVGRGNASGVDGPIIRLTTKITTAEIDLGSI